MWKHFFVRPFNLLPSCIPDFLDLAFVVEIASLNVQTPSAEIMIGIILRNVPTILKSGLICVGTDQKPMLFLRSLDVTRNFLVFSASFTKLSESTQIMSCTDKAALMPTWIAMTIFRTPSYDDNS